MLVDGLNVVLSPDEYWLMVRPVGFGSGNSRIVFTSGANGVNALIDGRVFVHGSGSGYIYNDLVFSAANFSMGINGYVLPEPTTMGLAAAGLLSLLLRRRR